jgi:hypothetical protein
MGFIQEKLILLVLPLIIAPLVVLLTQWTKKGWHWLDAQHPIIKQGVVAAYSAGFSALAAVVGKSICTDGSAVCDATGLDWRVILTWGVALAIHGWAKPKSKGTG